MKAKLKDATRQKARDIADFLVFPSKNIPALSVSGVGQAGPPCGLDQLTWLRAAPVVLCAEFWASVLTVDPGKLTRDSEKGDRSKEGQKSLEAGQRAFVLSIPVPFN